MYIITHHSYHMMRNILLYFRLVTLEWPETLKVKGTTTDHMVELYLSNGLHLRYTIMTHSTAS